MLQSVRHAFRTLRRAPGFSVAAVLILGLGIGANVAIFSLMDAVLFRPLPAVGEPAALVNLKGDTMSYPQYRVLAAEARGTLPVAASQVRTMSLTTVGDPQIVGGAVSSANYFDVLQARPALGRFFTAAEEEPGHDVVVLSHGLWKSRFGGDASVVGRTVRLNGVPFTVIGIAPEGYRGVQFGVYPDLWVTIGAMPRLATGGLARMNILSRNWGWLTVFGRLEPGVTRAGALATVSTILRRDASAHGEDFDAGTWSLVPTAAVAAGSGENPPLSRFFGILAAAVAAALLIASANLANLMLARAAARQREVAIRRALGASRGRLMGQMLAESVLL
jgi:putative ABC transport system permease protein